MLVSAEQQKRMKDHERAKVLSAIIGAVVVLYVLHLVVFVGLAQKLEVDRLHDKSHDAVNSQICDNPPDDAFRLACEKARQRISAGKILIWLEIFAQHVAEDFFLTPFRFYAWLWGIHWIAGILSTVCSVAILWRLWCTGIVQIVVEYWKEKKREEQYAKAGSDYETGQYRRFVDSLKNQQSVERDDGDAHSAQPNSEFGADDWSSSSSARRVHTRKQE